MMNDHYFTPDPGAASAPRALVYTLPWGELRLTADNGVFSKDGVDKGSDLLIRSLPDWQGRMLDLGCGYGPVGLSLALKHPGSSVVMADINARAVALARQNAAANRITGVTVLQSDGFAAVEGSFGLIATNPPIRAGKAVFFPWCESARDRLEPCGWFYAVIRKKQGAESCARHLAEVFGNCETVARSGGFHVLRAQKR